MRSSIPKIPNLMDEFYSNYTPIWEVLTEYEVSKKGGIFSLKLLLGRKKLAYKSNCPSPSRVSRTMEPQPTS